MEKLKGQAEAFCRKYLQCMDPDQAAAMAGCADGYAVLETKMVRRRLERMREAAAGQVHREDVVRRLAQLAFGRVNDAARLALHSEEADLETLDLSAVAELKVTDKGGVEVKLIDRIRALEALYGLLSEEKAAWGTVLHMLNHSLIKLVLFVAAGVVYLGTHSLNLNDIRGWGRNKPVLKVLFFVGAASIAGVPGFSGYVSKTLLHESIVEYIHVLEHAGAAAGWFTTVEWLFLLSGGLTAAYMTKLFVAIFVSSRAVGQRPALKDYMSPGTHAALSVGAALLLVLGLTPGLTMEPLAQWAGRFLRADPGHSVHYFAWVNLKGACISLAIGAAVYLLVVRGLLMRREADGMVYLDRWPARLDLENLVYRPLLSALTFVGALCARVAASVGDWLVLLGERILFTKAPGIFVPKRAENFGTYGRKPLRFLTEETFSFDLMLAGGGLIFLLLYMLL